MGLLMGRSCTLDGAELHSASPSPIGSKPAESNPAASGRMSLLRGWRENTMLQPGDKAPDFILNTLDGQPISLSDTLRSGHNVLLVFLRHLG